MIVCMCLHVSWQIWSLRTTRATAWMQLGTGILWVWSFSCSTLWLCFLCLQFIFKLHICLTRRSFGLPCCFSFRGLNWCFVIQSFQLVCFAFRLPTLVLMKLVCLLLSFACAAEFLFWSSLLMSRLRWAASLCLWLSRDNVICRWSVPYCLEAKWKTNVCCHLSAASERNMFLCFFLSVISGTMFVWFLCSKWAEDLLLFSSKEFSFVSISEKYRLAQLCLPHNQQLYAT